MNNPTQTSGSKRKYSLRAPKKYARYWVLKRIYKDSDGRADSCKAFECDFDEENPCKSAGQNKESRPSDMYRSVFAKDRDRIMYCAPFARLAGKTQIFRTGKNDHLRNRMTHTLEVSQISRTLAKALDLDVDLAEAIALGHDIGHTPFGHVGERVLNYTSTDDRERQIMQSKHIDGNIGNDDRRDFRSCLKNKSCTKGI